MKNNSLPVLGKGNDYSMDKLNTISTPLEYGELHRSTEATSKIMTRQPSNVKLDIRSIDTESKSSLIQKDMYFNALSTKVEALDADLNVTDRSYQDKKGDCLTMAQIEQWIDKSLQVCIDEKLSVAVGLKTF